jgi:transglutaminase-like putative cysteine protease
LNRYKLVHITQFRYDGLVSESYNELRLRPRHDDSQSCLSFRITTDPSSRPTTHVDYFGNYVHEFHILPEHRRLRVESEAVVLVHPAAPPRKQPVPFAEIQQMRDSLIDEHYDWLTESRYCPKLPELADLAREATERSDLTAKGFAEAASSLIHERFRYQKGATHVHSSIADCVATGAGVCQDFSHLLIAVLRFSGIPARYVSGYLIPWDSADQATAMERVIGGHASHAWVQAFIPETGWIGLDPTTGSLVEARHIRIAYGRDYGDVPPVRGVYKGHAGQSLSVDVDVRPALDHEGSELLDETSATPPPAVLHEEEQQQQQQ